MTQELEVYLVANMLHPAYKEFLKTLEMAADPKHYKGLITYFSATSNRKPDEEEPEDEVKKEEPKKEETKKEEEFKI